MGTGNDFSRVLGIYLYFILILKLNLKLKKLILNLFNKKINQNNFKAGEVLLMIFWVKI